MKTGTCAPVAALSLIACGGGGGGGGGSAAVLAPAAIQITQANAKPVGAHAAEAVQNTGAAQGSTGWITGVQIQGGDSGGASTLLLAEVARSLAAGASGLAIASGVAVSTASELRALL